jgi:hypothetical protein
VSNEGCALLASLNIPECAEISLNECGVEKGETPATQSRFTLNTLLLSKKIQVFDFER